MLRIARRALAAFSIILTFAGCQDAAGPLSPRALGPGPMMSRQAGVLRPLVLHQVPPHATDDAIQTRWLSDHYVWLDTAAHHRKRLFVHMPGTLNTPSSFQLVAQEAARLGYHVIVLTYPNDWEITICKADPSCQENLRMEVIDGIDRSPLIAVTQPHSIYNRLTKLLAYLADKHPAEGWFRFLDDGAPDWKRIVLSGSSFGGSEAAMLAKLHRVRRVTLFAAPRDTVAGGLPPGWVGLGATPAERYYGLVHDRDPLVAATLASWPLLGMSEFGDPVFVETSAPPYGGTHSLLTHLLPSSGSYANAHPSVSRDQFTPVTLVGPGDTSRLCRDQLTPLGPEVRPLLCDAWRYMLGAHEADDELAGDRDEPGDITVDRAASVRY